MSLAWATPTGNGFNNLKEEYEPGTLYFDPVGSGRCLPPCLPAPCGARRCRCAPLVPLGQVPLCDRLLSFSEDDCLPILPRLHSPSPTSARPRPRPAPPMQLNLKPEDDEELKVLQTKELNNGRLAMLAIAGFTLQELVPPHREIFEHLALYLEREIIEEIDDIDPALNIALPQIPQ